MSVDIKCPWRSHHVARLFVVVNQIKEDNRLNKNVEYDLYGLDTEYQETAKYRRRTYRS